MFLTNVTCMVNTCNINHASFERLNVFIAMQQMNLAFNQISRIAFLCVLPFH